MSKMNKVYKCTNVHKVKKSAKKKKMHKKNCNAHMYN